MKKWFIPVAAIAVIAVIALVTWRFALKPADPGYYKFYMVAIGDKGKRGTKLGCGDSLVAVQRQTVSDTKITDVYQDIVNMHDYAYDSTGLRNSLYQSDLQVQSATIDAQGIAHVDLTGTIKQSGGCDVARITGQLQQPAYQFKGVKSVDVRINGVDLAAALKPDGR